ncbi:unnamed protein product [Tenebrio molitor]|nr:unnamed protein product [Tenebrio molitor]
MCPSKHHRGNHPRRGHRPVRFDDNYRKLQQVFVHFISKSFLDESRRNSGENVDLWLERCKNAMVLIAEDINVYSKRSLRVILNHPGPVCFNASVLMEYCTTIRLANIVAVTTDEGISVISMMAEKIGELVENFWCPPVWGFSGIMSHVTVAAAAIKTEVYRPYKRALKTKETSKLPKGVVQQEIRFLGSLLKTEDSLYAEIERRRELEVKLLERQPILPKIRALGSLLRLWFSKEVGDDIISLGICSNGTVREFTFLGIK